MPESKSLSMSHRVYVELFSRLFRSVSAANCERNVDLTFLTLAGNTTYKIGYMSRLNTLFKNIKILFFTLCSHSMSHEP